MATKIRGKEMAVMIDGKVITGSTGCTMLSKCDLQEISSPHSGDSKEYMARRKSWKVTTNHLLDIGNMSDFSTLLGKKVQLRFTLADVIEGKWVARENSPINFVGNALVSTVQIDAQNKDTAKGSFEFTGTGALQTQ